MKRRATFGQKGPETELSGRSFTSLWDCSQHRHMHPCPGQPPRLLGAGPLLLLPPAPSCSVPSCPRTPVHSPGSPRPRLTPPHPPPAQRPCPGVQAGRTESGNMRRGVGTWPRDVAIALPCSTQNRSAIPHVSPEARTRMFMCTHAQPSQLFPKKGSSLQENSSNQLSRKWGEAGVGNNLQEGQSS